MQTTTETTLRSFWGDLPPHVREGIMFFLDGGIVPPTVIGDMIEEQGGDREWIGALLSWHCAKLVFEWARSSRWYSCQDKSVHIDVSYAGSNHVQTVRFGFRTVGERMDFGHWFGMGRNPGEFREWIEEHMGEFTFS